MFTFFFIISLLRFYLNILFCVFFCSSLRREYNCNEWHHLLSWISWWIPKLSRLFLACKSTPWEWNLHQFYCSSNRTNLWFHYCMVSQDHCYWLIQLYVAVKQGRNENISQSSVQIAIWCLNWCNWGWQCVFWRMRQTREIDFSLFAHEVAKHIEQKHYGWKNDLNLLLK